MSKFRKGLVKRVMAVILSGAMVMSNMSAYAAELSSGAADEYVETASEASGPEVEEADSDDAEKADAGDSAEVKETDAAVESETTASTETMAATEAATEKETEAEKTTETDAVAETTETESTETAAPVESETESETESTEIETETESTEMVSETEETSETETESMEEETTEESEDNAEAGVTNFEIKEDLVAGQEYGDEVLKFYVLEEMKKSTSKTPIVVGENTYADYVAGKNNPKNGTTNVSESKTLIPDNGAAFKIQPLKDARITFVISGVSSEKGDKHYYFVEDDGGKGKKIKSSSPDPSFESGAYDCDLEAGKTYYFFINGSKVNVYNIKWKDKNANRPVWAEVANPVISSVALSEKDKEKIEVTVDAIVGDNGADKLTVYMYNGKGVEVSKEESVKEQDQTTIEFAPALSGKYTFKAVTSRSNEEILKESEVTEPIECEVAMKQEWKYVTYGNGTGLNKDSVVPHDDGSVTITASSGKIVPNSNDGLTFYYTTLPSDMTFTFSANIHVDKWKYSNGQEGFGIMVADTVGDLSSKDPVKSSSRFWNNSYQAVISKISYKWNGVGISEDNSGESITMQLGVGATEKIGVTKEDVEKISNNDAQQPARYKAEQTAIDTTFAKYGEGQYNIVANCEEPPIGSEHELYEDFWLQIQKNNTGYFVSYAKYKFKTDENGNTLKDENGKPVYELTEDGKKIVDESTMTTKKYYDPEALSVLDTELVYVGVFAARNATITCSDISVEPYDSPDREPREPKYINLSKSVLSGSVTNTPDYTFVFASNWNGKFVLKDSSGNILSRHAVLDENGNPVKDENGNDKEIDYYDVKGTLDPEVQYYQDGDDAKDTKTRVPISGLSVGKNVFTVEYTPDPDWTPERDKYTGDPVIKLKTYETQKVTVTVEYKKYGEEGQTIYVSQEGLANNKGTKESPLDIYTAVKYAQPGQTILLAGGRYSLNRTLQIPKGVNGEPDLDENGKETYKKYIKMIGDPNADERPVLDFNSMVAAVVAVGDYWYFKDFDVIRCKDGEKGIQVSGSWCVYDRVDTYRNGSTGLQICRSGGTDTYKDWPHDNLILNCNSYLNVDKGYEDADGFAAKLTSGSNNVFDGCIAAFNADDGWDLFAKAQTGSIGGVIIKNSIAYRNGYVLKSVKDGSIKTPSEAAAEGDSVVCVKGDGNGNGFKMGGDGLAAGSQYDKEYEDRLKDPTVSIPNIGHRLYNSLAFGNKSKGFDSNSAPNVKAYNSVSFNNDGANISFSTYDTNKNTDYELQNVVSIRTGTDPSKVEVESEEREFEDGYKSKYSINFVSEADPGNKSAALYFSLKKAKSMQANVKVWWRNSDPETDCQLMILSEKGVVLGTETRTSNKDGLIISELETKGTEKCYLGAKGGSINLYKVEITATTHEDPDKAYSSDGPSKEATYTVDISDKYSSYKETSDLERNGKLEKIYSKPIETTLYYRAIPSDGVGSAGKQDNNKIENDSVYYWNVSKNAAINKSGKAITATEKDFVSLEYPYLNTVSPENWRNEDGTIKTDGFLQLKPGAGDFLDEDLPSIDKDKTPSQKPEDFIGEDTTGSITGGSTNPGDGSSDSDYGEDFPAGGLNVKDEKGNYIYFGKIWAADIKYVDYTDKEPIVYTGRAIQPEVHVRFSGNSPLLKKGKDYKLVYSNNINAGTATVTIIGQGNYKGYENTKEFTIQPIDISEGKDNSISIPSSVAVATGGDLIKAVKPTWHGNALKNGRDYTVTILEGNKLKVAGDGTNFIGERIINGYETSADKLMNKAKIKITTPSADIIYNQGEEVRPDFEVKMNGADIPKEQYKVEYANNKEIGKATLTVVGDGVNLFGSQSVNFSIKGGNIQYAELTYVASGKDPVKLADYVKTLDGMTFNGTSVSIPDNLIKVNLNGRTLKADIDYKIVQANTEKAGTATITVKGIKGYTGAQAVRFKTKPLVISNEMLTSGDIVCSYTPERTFAFGGTKYTADTDFFVKIKTETGYQNVSPRNYQISYKDNVSVAPTASNPKQPMIIVTGRNGLKGKIELPFKIVPATVTGNPEIVVTSHDIATNGKKIRYSDLKKSLVNVSQTVGKKNEKLKAGSDYNRNDIEYYVDTNDNFEIDEDDIKIDINSGEEMKEFDSTKGYLTVLVRVYVSYQGKEKENRNFEDGYQDGYFRIGLYDINKAKVKSKQDRVFGKDFNVTTGETTDLKWTVITDINDYLDITYKPDPSTEVDVNWIRKDENEYLIRPRILNEEGYVMVPNSYKKNDRVGTATFTIRGTGKYVGTKRVTFKIINKQTADKNQAK